MAGAVGSRKFRKFHVPRSEKTLLSPEARDPGGAGRKVDDIESFARAIVSPLTASAAAIRRAEGARAVRMFPMFALAMGASRNAGCGRKVTARSHRNARRGGLKPGARMARNDRTDTDNENACPEPCRRKPRTRQLGAPIRGT